MRARVAAALFAALAAAAPLPLRGAVEGSPHDLIAQGYDLPKVSQLQERCSRCHITVTAADQGFLPPVPPVLAATWGESSLGCFSCHDGTTIVGPDVDASLTAFHPAAHGSDLAGYEGLHSETTELPHLDGDRMECVTCHDPHDNGHRPFLRMELDELCLACHSRQSEVGSGSGNRTGNHPIGTNPAAAPRAQAPIKVSPAFRVPFPAAYPPQRGKGSPGIHWVLGGHLADGGGGALACPTCHLVHGEESAAPRAALLALEPKRDLADAFCEGCHAGERGDEGRSAALPNPGGTTKARTYHPADDDLGNGEGRLVEVSVPREWPLGGGSPARLICTTCHMAHGARPATELLRPPVEGRGFCEECHELLPPWHHPLTAEGPCAPNIPAPAEGEPAGMRCVHCHRAHNAGLGSPDETRFVPLLRASNWAEACVRCHPAGNPACSSRDSHYASHYLGDPAVDYGDLTPPLRLDPWPESGLLPHYEGADNRTVTCQSCHAFREGVLLSGDDPKKARHLVARAGNNVEWEAGEETKYLCVGCHSVAPGTGGVEGTKGHSHPMMDASVERLGREIAPPATATPGGRINCDSCHRSHGADTRGGYYILEVVDGLNADPAAIQPKIDFTPICHKCHGADKY